MGRLFELRRYMFLKITHTFCNFYRPFAAVRNLGVMRNNHNRALFGFVKLQKQLHNIVPRLLVEVSRRLIAQQHIGII